MSPEILAALIALGGATFAGQMALWLRFEHRMTVIEERLRMRENMIDDHLRHREKVIDERFRSSGLGHYSDPLTP